MFGEKFARRDILKALSAASIAACSPRLALAATASPHPDATTFQSGDFLWPAKPGAFIPRSLTLTSGPSEEANLWTEEKRKFIEQVRQSGNADQAALADSLERLTFKQFKARYFDGSSGVQERGMAERSTVLPQVGHVAIIEIDAKGAPWVVEAMPKAKHRYESLYSHFTNGVIRSSYVDWIALHKEYNVWHGRLNHVDEDQRGGIVTEAKSFLGKDYWFWSFNLSDENAFYCSKLVWVSVWKAINVAMDGDSRFARNFWVSPKRLLNSRFVDLLHNPGAYGAR